MATGEYEIQIGAATRAPRAGAQAVAVALTMPVNFIGNKLWTFA
jgi:putative flippase GtrA